MKTIKILLCCLFATVMAFGQIETSQLKRDIEEVKVSPPKFTGIEKAVAYFNADRFSQIDHYLAENFICPKEVAECNIEGTEIIQFTVDTDGSLINFNVINSVNHKVDEELIRVLKTTDRMWMPGHNNGKPTAMEQEVSVIVGNRGHDENIKHFVKKAEIYFEKASTNLLVEHKPKKALRSYNSAVCYMPNDKALLLMRGICHYELGNKEEARTDWQRINSLGGIAFNVFEDLADMKGYTEMKTFLAKK